MTARIARALAGLAGVALLVAACGGSTPSGAASVAPTAAPTAAATQGPGATNANPTFPTASLHGDVDLEALFPDEIAGKPLQVLSMTGEQMVADGDAAEMGQMLTLLGKTPADLSAAFGGVTEVGIVAFQVDGAPGNQIFEALKSASETAVGATVTPASYGGKSVQKFVPTDDDASYIYIYQDVVFIVTGAEITDATLNEVFSKLP